MRVIPIEKCMGLRVATPWTRLRVFTRNLPSTFDSIDVIICNWQNIDQINQYTGWKDDVRKMYKIPVSEHRIDDVAVHLAKTHKKHLTIAIEGVCFFFS